MYPTAFLTSSAVEEVILLIVRSNVSVISDSKQSNGDEILALAKDGHAKNVTAKTGIKLVHKGLATIWPPELKLDHGVAIHINDRLIVLFKMVT